ncbi:MAG: protein kinase [Polyangiales bacterium]
MVAAQYKPGNELGRGKYRLVRALGAGSFGTVFEAINTTTKRRVAVKVLHPDLVGDEVIGRLRQEAEVASRVHHRNVVDIYDFVHENEGEIFLVMEYLEGETLEQVLTRRRLGVHEALTTLLAVMRGLRALHGEGVVHRDVKPENIFLACETDNPELVPKLLDFGISKVAGSTTLTQLGTQGMGSLMYMSPEQYADARMVDQRADVYSMGVVLYECLTGQRPYDASSQPNLMWKILTTAPRAPRELAPELSPALEDVVQRAMARDLAERIPSIDELSRLIAPFAQAPSRGVDHDAGVQRLAESVGTMDETRDTLLAVESAHEIALDDARPHGVGWKRHQVLGAVGCIAAACLLAALWLTSRSESALRPTPRASVAQSVIVPEEPVFAPDIPSGKSAPLDDPPPTASPAEQPRAPKTGVVAQAGPRPPAPAAPSQEPPSTERAPKPESTALQPTAAKSAAGSPKEAGSARTPTLTVDPPVAEVEGDRSPERLTAIVNANTASLQRCYEDAVRLAGRALVLRGTLTFRIAASGVVEAPRTADYTLPGMSECLVAELQKWTFPPSAEPSVVTFPFTFDHLTPELTPEQVSKIVAENSKYIRSCNEAMQRALGEPMRLELKLEINARGEVTSAKAPNAAPGTEHCIERGVRMMRFPPASAPISVSISIIVQ